MQREYCLIEGSIQGTVVFEWDPMGFEVIAKTITLENEYGTVEIRRDRTDFERGLFNLIEATLLAGFADDEGMRDFWRRAEASEYRGHRRRA